MGLFVAQIASSFIAPALVGAGAAAIAIPIVIHLLSRLRRKRQRWGAMRFLRLAYQKQKNRLRLEQWLLLATRCLLVLLIGLALAGPVVGGALARWLSGAGGGGRTVHVVIDDSLSSGAVEINADSASPETRLDALKRDASALLDSLGAGDRVVLWRASQPDTALEAPANQLGPLRAELEQWRPAAVAADWPGLVSAVSAKVERDDAAARPVVAVLSGFARGDGGLTEPAPAGLAMLADRAAVALRRPASSRPNRQVAAVVPRRAVVVPQGGDAAGSVSVNLTARRFEDAAEPASAVVRVELLRPEHDAGTDLTAGRVVASAQRDVSWSVGQSEVTLALAVPLPPLPEGFDRQALAVRAVLLDRDGSKQASDADTLRADNEAYSVVEAVRLLRVGVQGGQSTVGTGDSARAPETAQPGSPAAASDGLGPAVFVRAALGGAIGDAPGGIVTGALTRVDVDTLTDLDAAFVLSPSQVGPGGWSSLRDWVRAGGVLWVMPDADTRGSLNWPALMSRAFGDAVAIDAELDELPEPAALSEGSGAPQALSLLSGSWSALLGPVRVSRVVGVDDGPSDSGGATALDPGEATTPGGSPGDASAVHTGEGTWLSWGENDEPWLLAKPHGRGTVVWLGSAMDPAWTNLPAKPLFPALVQDALRSAVSQRLGRRAWSADENAPAGLDVSRAQPVAIENADPGAPPTPADPVNLDAATSGPGVYVLNRGADHAALVGVNVQADAGDTRALDEVQLAAWWDALGGWSWLPDEPAAFLASESPRAALHTWLLWAVLALLVLETWLSRSFSHATTDRPGLRRRAMTLIDHWRLGEFADRARRKAA